MNISTLFDRLVEETQRDELTGELNLDGNCIIWSYDLNNNSEEIQIPIENNEEDEFSFHAVSPEELLREAYDGDLIKIEQLIADIDEFAEWTFSEPDINETTISFKIF